MEEHSSEITSSTPKYPETIIPTQLKFLMTNIKNTLSIQLTTDNHPLWKAQVHRLFSANGFQGHLDGSISSPPQQITNTQGISNTNPDYTLWNLIDQNLAAALYATISPSILPYVLSLPTCHSIWTTLENRLQATNRSRLIQLRNELHHISLANRTLQQYLSDIKTKTDAIAAAGQPLPAEDIIYYTLNGLPSNYQAFKTAIRTNIRAIDIDEFYSLLCNEETNLSMEAARDLHNLHNPLNPTALFTSRGRGRSNTGRGRFSHSRTPNTSRPFRNLSPPVPCQICSKRGHTAVNCWFRHDTSYNSSPSHNKALLATSNTNTNTADWILDSGATTHLTSDFSNLSTASTYNGDQQIALGNGNTVPISHTGNGILPTPFTDRPDSTPRPMH